MKTFLAIFLCPLALMAGIVTGPNSGGTGSANSVTNNPFTVYVAIGGGNDSPTNTGLYPNKPLNSLTNAVTKSPANYFDCFVQGGTALNQPLVFNNYSYIRLRGSPNSPVQSNFGQSIAPGAWAMYYTNAGAGYSIWSNACPTTVSNLQNFVSALSQPYVFEVGTYFGVQPTNLSGIASHIIGFNGAGTFPANYTPARMPDYPYQFTNTVAQMQAGLIPGYFTISNTANSSTIYVAFSDGKGPSGRTVTIPTCNYTDRPVQTINCGYVEIDNIGSKFGYNMDIQAATMKLDNVYIEGTTFHGLTTEGNYDLGGVEVAEAMGTGFQPNVFGNGNQVHGTTRDCYFHDSNHHNLAVLPGVSDVSVGDVYSYCNGSSDFSAVATGVATFVGCYSISNALVAAFGADGTSTGGQLMQITLMDCVSQGDQTHFKIGPYSQLIAQNCILNNTPGSSFIQNSTNGAKIEMINCGSSDGSQIKYTAYPANNIQVDSFTPAGTVNGTFTGNGAGLTNLSGASLTGSITNGINGTTLTVRPNASGATESITAQQPIYSYGYHMAQGYGFQISDGSSYETSTKLKSIGLLQVGDTNVLVNGTITANCSIGQTNSLAVYLAGVSVDSNQVAFFPMFATNNTSAGAFYNVVIRTNTGTSASYFWATNGTWNTGLPQ